MNRQKEASAAYYRANKDKIAAKQKEWRARNKSRVAGYVRRQRLKTSYGIGEEDYNEMFLKQDGMCGICKQVPNKNLCVDHCHTTGKIRGLLCTGCNVAVGLLGDTAEGVRRALSYLEK